jgi:hypothetical protein
MVNLDAAAQTTAGSSGTARTVAAPSSKRSSALRVARAVRVRADVSAASVTTTTRPIGTIGAAPRGRAAPAPRASATTAASVTTTTEPPSARKVPTAPTTGWTSTKWSGYVLSGASAGYSEVGAQWTVPTLDCSAVPDGSTSDWVGVNGWNGAPGLFQAGTTSQCVNGQQISTAVWSDSSDGYVFSPLFNVAPGDVVEATVSTSSSESWAYSVTDATSGAVGAVATAFTGPGVSAEWIAEDTTDLSTGAPYPLADFGAVTFADLTINGGSGSSPAPNADDAIAMVSSTGRVEAAPSPVTLSGGSASFTVTYRSPRSGGPVVYSVAI